MVNTANNHIFDITVNEYILGDTHWYVNKVSGGKFNSTLVNCPYKLGQKIKVWASAVYNRNKSTWEIEEIKHTFLHPKHGQCLTYFNESELDQFDRETILDRLTESI